MMQNPQDCLMTTAEMAALLQLARGETVLEIGSWRGVGTLTLAQVADQVVSVDWHIGDLHLGSQDTLSEFMARVMFQPDAPHTIAIVGHIGYVLPILRRDHFGLVIVDAAHDRESVIHDCDQAQALVKPGGTVAVHDYGRDQVEEGAMRVLGAPDRMVESLAWWTLR